MGGLEYVSLDSYSLLEIYRPLTDLVDHGDVSVFLTTFPFALINRFVLAYFWIASLISEAPRSSDDWDLEPISISTPSGMIRG